jgi:hypothetical protein
MNQSQDKLDMEQIYVLWPFIKYKILMPEMSTPDLFEWLYIKLIVFYNKVILKLDDPHILHQESVLFVENEISSKFSHVINNEILLKVKDSVHKRTVDVVKNDVHTGERAFKGDVVKTLNAEPTFGEALNTFTVYQECVLGEIIPYFDDEVDEELNNDLVKINRNTTPLPTSRDIIKSYDTYLRIEKNQELKKQSDSKVSDEDSQDTETEFAFYEFYDDIEFEVEEMESGDSRKINIEKVNILFLDKSDLIFLKIGISIDQYGEYKAYTAFDSFGNETLARVVSKAELTGVSLELNKILKMIKSDEELTLNREDILQFDGQDPSSNFVHFRELFLLSRTAKDNNLAKYVRVMEREFDAQNPSFFINSGKFLECLVETVVSRDNRKMQIEHFDQYLSQMFQVYDWTIPLNFRNVHTDWIRGKATFKSDVLDILLRHPNALIAKGLEKNTIRKIFDIYNARNVFVHHSNRKYPEKVEFDSSINAELVNFTKYILNLY